MPWTLQEMCYLQLAPRLRRQLPDILRHSVQQKLATRILRWYRHSKRYRLRFVTALLNEGAPLARVTLKTFFLEHPACLGGSRKILKVVELFHDCFHDTDAPLERRIMEQVLMLLVPPTPSAHAFFGAWTVILKHGRDLDVDMWKIHKVVDLVPAELLRQVICFCLSTDPDTSATDTQ